MTVEGVREWWIEVFVATIEGEERGAKEDTGSEGEGWETEGRGAEWLAARLNTSSGDRESWCGGGAVPGGGSSS